mmetsp:Transcript_24412/g.46259  ORF Transcript_24412/g.46259 Transcript_24412/m.46259 type:complete len:147 (-) Transcript_24412:54-494(-)
MGDQRNFVHEDENWRQRVRFEVQAQRVFDDNWGFLTAKKDDEADPNIRFDTRLVKYFNPAGGTWTVRTKRVPERVRETNMDESGTLDEKTAIGAARTAHGERMDHIARHDAAFTTMSGNIGNRRTLEQVRRFPRCIMHCRRYFCRC